MRALGLTLALLMVLSSVVVMGTPSASAGACPYLDKFSPGGCSFPCHKGEVVDVLVKAFLFSEQMNDPPWVKGHGTCYDEETSKLLLTVDCPERMIACRNTSAPMTRDSAGACGGEVTRGTFRLLLVECTTRPSKCKAPGGQGLEQAGVPPLPTPLLWFLLPALTARRRASTRAGGILLAGLGLLAFAGPAAADPVEYAVSPNGVTPVCFPAGHIVPDADGGAAVSIVDDVSSPVSGTVCAGPQGCASFCGTASLVAGVNWDPESDVFVYVDDPVLGSAPFSACGSTYSAGTHGFVTHT